MFIMKIECCVPISVMVTYYIGQLFLALSVVDANNMGSKEKNKAN